MNADATLRDFFTKARELEKERQSTEPKEFCKRFWSLLRPLYVANPADADKIHWERCERKCWAIVKISGGCYVKCAESSAGWLTS